MRGMCALVQRLFLLHMLWILNWSSPRLKGINGRIDVCFLKKKKKPSLIWLLKLLWFIFFIICLVFAHLEATNRSLMQIKLQFSNNESNIQATLWSEPIETFSDSSAPPVACHLWSTHRFWWASCTGSHTCCGKDRWQSCAATCAAAANAAVCNCRKWHLNSGPGASADSHLL